MARKTAADLKGQDKLLAEAVEDFKLTSEMKRELAKTAYDIQDGDTQEAIDGLVATLQSHASGYITVQLSPPNGAVVPVKIDNLYLGYNLLWLAVEQFKALATLGIRIANFEFPPSLCSECGAEIVPEKKSRKVV